MRRSISSFFGAMMDGKERKSLKESHLSAQNITEIYTLGHELGTGGFSVVKKGTRKDDGSEWALKLIRNGVFKKNEEATMKEVKILLALENPGVVKLKEVVTTPRHFVIVMELLTGGELFDRIVQREKYTENDAKLVVTSLLSTLQYLHKNKIVHRDIKPENLIFDTPAEDANLKLTDFGFADLNLSTLNQACGTPEYVAPEILDEKPYDEKVDMWSTGVIIYILLCGFPPFYGDNDEELFEKVTSCSYSFPLPYWKKVSDEAKDLISKLLELNPKKRLSATQALKHPWFGESESEENDLQSALEELNRFRATQKFRKAVYALMAANKMSNVAGLSNK